MEETNKSKLNLSDGTYHSYTRTPKSASKSKLKQASSLVTVPQSPSKHAPRRTSSSVAFDSNNPFGHHSEITDVQEEDEVLPEHHQVLYDLLGADKAESILNPKMEEPAKTKQEARTDHRPIRRLPTVDTGLGADALWKILKKESDKKLQRMDRRIPEDWKVSYGAFLRENINQSRPLVHRSFTQHSDVPELSKLLDQRYKERVKRARHHSNVMFRSSKNNKNRTALLLNNNPVPDYNDREGTTTLARYFDDIGHSHTEEVRVARVSTAVIPIRKQSVSEAERVRRLFSGLHFLTEDSARAKGTFYAKYDSAETVKMVTDVPGYRAALPLCMTSRVVVTAPAGDPTIIRGSIDQRHIFSRKAATSKRDPTWQPLTVGALLEYTSSKPVMGLGEYHYGQASRWKTPAPSTV